MVVWLFAGEAMNAAMTTEANDSRRDDSKRRMGSSRSIEPSLAHFLHSAVPEIGARSCYVPGSDSGPRDERADPKASSAVTVSRQQRRVRLKESVDHVARHGINLDDTPTQRMWSMIGLTRILI